MAGRIRATVICPWIARDDAFGAIARDTADALAAEGDIDVALIATRFDVPDERAVRVKGIAELLMAPAFLKADILIYHFPIYHPFFDAVLVGNGRGKQVVRFHNITPKEFTGPEMHETIERSFRQVQNFWQADEIWADSHENALELRRQGIDERSIYVIPPSVERPPRSSLRAKATAPVRLLYVGRFVASKGVLDLVQAADLARRSCNVPFELRLVGNVALSRAEYVEQIVSAIEERGLKDVVIFVGAVDEPTLARHYHEAHCVVTASRHEGFCIPIIEGLRAGCIPIGYALGATPDTMGGLGRVVEPVEVEALAQAIAEVVEGIARSARHPMELCLPVKSGPLSAVGFDCAAQDHTDRFTFEAFRHSVVSRVRALVPLAGQTERENHS